MKKLNRIFAKTPTCLSKFDHLRHGWHNVKPRHKKIIWDELDLIQEKFCVYCEMPAAQGDHTTGHIEHFYNKGNVSYKHLTFDWNNLFGCCPSTHHCGHFKDMPINGAPRAYDANLLIKPDVDDPNEYLQFLSTGKVEPKEGLDDIKRNKASVTIDVLGLDCSILNSSRENAIKNFNARLIALNEILELGVIGQDEYAQFYFDIKKDVMVNIHRTAVDQVVFS